MRRKRSRQRAFLERQCLMHISAREHSRISNADPVIMQDSLQASHNVDKSLRGSRSAYNKSSIPVSNSNDPDSDENTTGQPLPSPLNDSSLSNLVWSSITDILNILKASDDEAYALTQSHVENLSRRILRGGNPDDWIEIKSLVESMEKASQFQGKSPKAPLVYIRGKLFDEEARTNHTYNKIIKSIDVLKEANPGQGDVMFQLDFLSETMLDKEDFHQGWSDKTSKLLNMTLISLETIFKQHRARLMSAKVLREKLFNNRMLHSHWTEHDYVAMAGDLEAIGKANQTHSKTWLATTFAPTFANLERSFAELSMESPKASNARQSIPGERPLVPESISKIGQEIENRVGEVRRPQHRVPGPGLGAAPEISRKSPNSITIEFHPPDTFSLDWSKSQFQKILTNCGVTVSPAMIDTNSDTRSLITKLADTQEVKKMLITLYCNAVGMRELLHFLIKGNTWDPLSTFVKYGRDLTDESKNEFQRTLEGYGIEVSKVFEAKAESTLIAYIPNTWDIEKNMRALADVAADHNTKMEFCFEGKPLRSKVEIDQSSPENLTSSVPRSKKRLRDDVDTNIKGAQKTFLNQAADPPRSANRPSLSTARDSQQMTSSRGNMEHSSSNHSAPQGDLYAERREPRNNSRHMSRETYKQPRSASRSNNHGGDNWNRRSGSPRRGWGRMGDSRSNRRLSGSSRFDSNMRESTYGQHRRNSSSFCDDGNMREGEPDKRSRDAETTNYSDLFDEDRSARKGSNTRNQEYRRN